MNEDRMIGQLDRMVESGRITPDEATRLRAAQGTPEMGAVMGEIRARHATPHIEAAVTAGDMTPDEAERQLQLLREGEHPKGLRARLRQHRKPRSPDGDAA